MSNTNRRTFLQLMGLTGAAALTTMKANIARALGIAANSRTGTIQDVEHVVILMQENRPFDHHFGTLRGVRGYNDPRAIKINLPLKDGSGSTPVSVFLQPAGAANIALATRSRSSAIHPTPIPAPPKSRPLSRVAARSSAR